MARINVEQQALSDARYVILGRLLGTSRYDALGRMVYLWNYCQERETYTVSDDEAAAIFEHESAGTFLEKSKLAQRKNATTLRIKGTKGRIEWLANRRKEGRLGGKKGGRPKKPLGGARNETPRGSRLKTPPAPAPALEESESEQASLRSTRLQGEQPDAGPADREILTNDRAVQTAEDYRRHVVANVYQNPDHHALQSAVEKLKPVGIYPDTGSPVLSAPRAARAALKATPEFQRVIILEEGSS